MSGSRGASAMGGYRCRGQRRVVVTGVGVVSPIGTGSAAFWSALHDGARVADVTSVAAESMGSGNPRTAGRIGRLALAAARLALEDAGLSADPQEAGEAGVFLGANLDDVNVVGLCRSLGTARTARGGDPDWGEFARRARGHLHPFDYLRALSNMPAAHLAIRHGLRGVSCSYMAHGISGAEAIGEAYQAIREGAVTWALAGGADSQLTPWALWKRGIIGGSPLARCRPFSRLRSNPHLGEGAALMVLEPLERVRARGARVYAEIAGYATRLDASGFPAPAGGAGLARCITAALVEAGIGPRDVAYLSAHGEGSLDGDRLEADAIRRVFGAAMPAVCCLKVLTGHLGAASGAVEAAGTALAIERQQVPAAACLEHPDPDLDLPQPRAHPSEIEWALNVAHHALGLCAALVFKRASAAGPC